MVKSETRRDAKILIRNPSPRLFGKKYRDSKKVNTNHAKTRFRDPAKIFQDPRFSRYHSPPFICCGSNLYWFKFYFLSFQNHYHTLPYPKTTELQKQQIVALSCWVVKTQRIKQLHLLVLPLYNQVTV